MSMNEKITTFHLSTDFRDSISYFLARLVFCRGLMGLVLIQFGRSFRIINCWL